MSKVIIAFFFVIDGIFYQRSSDVYTGRKRHSDGESFVLRHKTERSSKRYLYGGVLDFKSQVNNMEQFSPHATASDRLLLCASSSNGKNIHSAVFHCALRASLTRIRRVMANI